MKWNERCYLWRTIRREDTDLKNAASSAAKTQSTQELSFKFSSGVICNYIASSYANLTDWDVS